MNSYMHKIRFTLVLVISAISITESYSQWDTIARITTEDLSGIYFVNDSVGFIVGGNNTATVLKTTDGGQSWSSSQSGSIYPLRTVSFKNTTDGFSAGVKAPPLGTRMHTTLDQGDNWNYNDLSGISMSVTEIAFSSASTGYMTGRHHAGVATMCLSLPCDMYVAKTTDGGNSWSYINADVNTLLHCRGNDLQFFDNNTGYVVGENARVIKTTDGGTNWTDKSPVIIADSLTEFMGLYFFDAMKGFVVGQYSIGGIIVWTTDGGENWDTMTTPEILTNITFQDNMKGYITGNSGTIYQTADGGVNWERVYTNTTERLQNVWILNDSTGYIVGNEGVILKRVKYHPLSVRFIANQIACDRTELKFINNSINGDSFAWKVNDLYVSDDKDYAHTFLGTGLQSVKLIGYNHSSGAVDSFERLIEIIDVPSASFETDKDSFYTNNVVEFFNTSVNSQEYKWYVNNTLFSTDSSPLWIANAAGDHVVKLVATNECGLDSADKTIYVFDFLSGIPFSGVSSLAIYPNPVNDILNFEMTAEGKSNLAIAVYDPQGKILFSKDIESGEGRLSLQIDTRPFNAGLIFIHVSNEKGEFFVTPVLKN